MKKVLVSRTMLPVSMSLTHNMGHSAVPQQAHCAVAPVHSYQEPIPKLMLKVVFESDELAVLRGVLTGDVYTIDKSRNIVMEEPTEEAVVVYHHLHNLGIKDQFLNMFHYDTLTRVYENGKLVIDDGGSDNV